jgi:hypothetical protein
MIDEKNLKAQLCMYLHVDIKNIQFKKLTWSQQAFMSRFSSSGNQLMICGLLFSSLIAFLTS